MNLVSKIDSSMLSDHSVSGWYVQYQVCDGVSHYFIKDPRGIFAVKETAHVVRTMECDGKECQMVLGVAADWLQDVVRAYDARRAPIASPGYRFSCCKGCGGCFDLLKGTGPTCGTCFNMGECTRDGGPSSDHQACVLNQLNSG